MRDMLYLLTGKPHPMPWTEERTQTAQQRKAYAKIRAERTASKAAKKAAVLKAIGARFYSVDEIARAVNVTPHWARVLLRELVAEGKVAKQAGSQRTYWTLPQ